MRAVVAMCIAILGGAALFPAAGAAGETPLPCLKLEERAAIVDLMARYAQYADAGAGDAFATMFVAEGALHMQGKVVQGRADLAQMINSKVDRTLHLPSAPVLVKVADGRVRARSQLLYMRDARGADATGPVTQSGFAVYEDTIVKTAEGWKFVERRVGDAATISPEFLTSLSEASCANSP